MDPNWPGGPPPGWYPDPTGQKAWRWWDGYQWTGYASDPVGPGVGGMAPHPGHMAPPQGVHRPGVIPPSVVLSARDRLAAELDAAPWARRALPLYVLSIGLGMLSLWSSSANFRHIYHQVRVAIQTGVAQHTTTVESGRTQLLNVLLLAAEVAFYVLFLIWQFRAAKTARLLSLPAKHSAGMGVGGWFIPIVNLWFPYQAIRDCLPPDDPGRAVVGRLWAFFISTSVVLIVADVLAVVGNPIGFVFAALTLALATGFALQSAKAIELIAQAHRRLLDRGPAGEAGQQPWLGR